ncbi:retron Ec78 anti-phage system effector HNH endonuclease PtuB [Chitinibacter sp. FCG-7]|uniref:Retron Ec78 anti-phage system effector HNH endonuclease PtuB n=1 Tax=Chitinibacter mangrovi TaxID=3153927 RepID=A0AAU7FCV1_9NEIS
MHKLKRGAAPACLAKFQHGRDNWNDVTAEQKQTIWQALFTMQGERCAYCEANISHAERHIEHFRQKGRDATQTFVWGNLFGSCNNGSTCGKHKDEQPIYPAAILIKPDVENPEDFLRFHSNGTISIRKGLNEADQHRASETIRLFNLADGSLRWQRHKAALDYIQTAEEIAGLAAEDPELAEAYLASEITAIVHLPFATAIKHTLQNI